MPGGIWGVNNVSGASVWGLCPSQGSRRQKHPGLELRASSSPPPGSEG